MNFHKRRVSAVIDHVNVIAPPIDFSFMGLTSPCDTIDEVPRIRSNGLKKGSTKTFKPSTLHLNNNALTDCKGVINALVACSGMMKVLRSFFAGVSMQHLKWINLSCNQLRFIPDEIVALQQLQILYFHSNHLPGFSQVSKLQLVANLRSLTLHANPIAEKKNYRTKILVLLPKLRSLDFSDVTPSEAFEARAMATMNLRIQQRNKRSRAYD